MHNYDRGHPDAVCSQLGVLQLACAALEALDHKGNHHRDKIYATEKVHKIMLCMYNTVIVSINDHRF